MVAFAFQRYLEIKFFDDIQYIPLVDMLVIGGSHVNDLAGDLGGHVCDLHTDHTVARPWRRYIDSPAVARSNKRCGDKHAGREIP